MTYLDSAPDVMSWDYERIEIPYASSKHRVRRYLPDFIVVKADGSCVVVEVKPASRVDRPTNVKKFAAARAWCTAAGMTFEIVTEVELRALGLLGGPKRRKCV
jgi:hypothetical protein